MNITAAAAVVVLSFYIEYSHALLKPLRRKPSVATFTQTKDNSIYIGSNDPNTLLLPALVKELSSSREQVRLDALDALGSIKNCKEDYMITMGSKELGLLPILKAIISSDSGTSRKKALEIMSSASYCSANNAYMLSLELGLVPVLASVLASGSNSDNCHNSAITILFNTMVRYQRYRFTDNSQYDIGSKDLGILPSLVMVLDPNYETLSILEVLVKDIKNRVYMGSEELGLLSALANLLFYSENGAALSIVCGILDSLYEEPENRAYMDSNALAPIQQPRKIFLPIETPATCAAAAAAIVQTPALTQPPTPNLMSFTIYAEMWELITDPSKAVDPEKLRSFLSEQGLSRAYELGYCDSAMWKDLTAHLKPIPKRVVEHILDQHRKVV